MIEAENKLNIYFLLILKIKVKNNFPTYVIRAAAIGILLCEL